MIISPWLLFSFCCVCLCSHPNTGPLDLYCHTCPGWWYFKCDLKIAITLSWIYLLESCSIVKLQSHNQHDVVYLDRRNHWIVFILKMWCHNLHLLPTPANLEPAACDSLYWKSVQESHKRLCYLQLCSEARSDFMRQKSISLQKDKHNRINGTYSYFWFSQCPNTQKGLNCISCFAATCSHPIWSRPHFSR